MSEKKTKNLLIEIGCEELPASCQKLAREVLGAVKLDIRHGRTEILTTPRRITCYIESLPESQDDSERRVFGPPKRAAFNENGKPTAAAVGFAQSVGLKAEDLKIEKKGNNDYVCASVVAKGKDTYSYLCGCLGDFIAKLTFPKPMRWIENKPDEKFSRPVRWTLALYGDKVIKFNAFGIDSGRITFGNRLVSEGKISIETADIEVYKKTLKKASVVVDREERKKIIDGGLRKFCGWTEEKGAGASQPAAESTADLIEEVTDLVEWPQVIKGGFDGAYLALPRELVRTCMMEHQRFFPVVGNDGKLCANFISIVNNPLKSAESAIRKGNENVLRARLADAKFFYEHDIKEGIDAKLERLKDIIFQGGMGSMQDKVKRIEGLSVFIADDLGLDEEKKKKVIRAAQLSKIDIGTQVRNEFPSLQGTIGKIYAVKFGEDKEVAEAIEEQYLPRLQTGLMPRMTGAIVGVADRIDNICAFFAQGYAATGSEDPFGARRDAQKMLEVLEMPCVADVMLDSLMDKALSLMQDKIKNPNAKAEIASFLRQRLQTLFERQKFSYDEIDAVMDYALESLNMAKARAAAIQELRSAPEFTRIITAFKRVVNILKQAGVLEKARGLSLSCAEASAYAEAPAYAEASADRSADRPADRCCVREELLKDKEEKGLWETYTQIKDEVQNKVKNNNFKEAMEFLFARLSRPIDDFFDHVMVMDKDETLRSNRLALLSHIAAIFFLMADFSKIVVAE